MKEQRGKRKLWYEDGKKTNCDYNRYNDYFFNLCIKDFLGIIKSGSISTYECLRELLTFIIGFSFWILIIITFPISIPVRVLMNKRRLLYSYGRSIDYKYIKENK